MGKKTYQSFSGYGVDVGQHRADDLDKKALEYFSSKPEAIVLELGAGTLGQSKRIAALGVQVIAIDIHDFSSSLESCHPNVSFIQADIKTLPKVGFPGEATDIVLQRTLHYLRYTEALELLEYVHRHTSGTLFISVTGIHSDIGEYLEIQNQPLEGRWSLVTDEGQLKFGITKPVCLYTEKEFEGLLLQAGWKVDELWVSAFNNLKAVCSH
jgi:hypothetical protein